MADGRPLTVRLVEQARRTLRRQRDRRAALRALAAFETELGPLPAALKRRAREDAIERLGDKRHERWLMAFAAAAGTYRDGWLPVGYFDAVAAPILNGAASDVTETRALTSRLLSDASVPDLVYCINGLLLDADGRILTPNAACRRLGEAGREFIFKSDGSHSGLGTRSLSIDILTPETLSQLGNGVLQPRIAPHPAFDAFGLAALPTLRVGTVIGDGGGAPEVRCCYLKLARRGDAHNRASNQVRVAVDWRRGTLADHGFTSVWGRVTAHPDGGPGFSHIALPDLAETFAAARRLHACYPLARFLLWDLAIDDAGQPKLLEWERGRVHFAEVSQGPCFADLGWDRLHLSPGNARPG